MDSSILGRFYLMLMNLILALVRNATPTCTSVLKAIFHEFNNPVSSSILKCLCVSIPAPGLQIKIAVRVVSEYQKLLKNELFNSCSKNQDREYAE